MLTWRGPRQGAVCGGAVTASSEGVYSDGI
jgi:hypothetical protein